MLGQRSSSHTCRKTRSTDIRSPPTEEKEEQEHSWWNFARMTANLCLMVAIGTIVLCFQIKNRPMVTVIYHTSNPWDNSRGGAIYTCGCVLPTSLQGPEYTAPPSSADSRNISLNVCYDVSSLETVTILMYSNSAAAKVETIINESTSKPLRYQKTVEGGGYNVTQEAHDISVRGFDSKYLVDNTDPLSRKELEDFNGLYLGGYKQDDLVTSSEDLLSDRFTNFPPSYVRLSFMYNCYNCSSCNLTLVHNITAKVVANGEVWADCFLWSLEPDQACSLTKNYQNLPKNSYVAKCLLYPTEALPTTFAVKSFFKTFLDLPGIQVLQVPPVPIFENDTILNLPFKTVNLQPSFLYMNISTFKNSSIQFGFVEVEVGSALWVSLSTKFRHLDTQCSAAQQVQVCNGTSLCNLFSNVDSYYLRSLDMKDNSMCRKIMNGTTLDNYENHTTDGKLYMRDASENVLDWTGLECRDFTCSQNVSSYKAIWNTPPIMKDDALNQFLYSRIQNDEWAQRSGLCKMNYTNVFRYVLEGTSGSTIMFLHTNCTWSNNKIINSRLNHTGIYCWLSRDFNFFDDTPDDPPKKLGDDLFSDLDRSFVCYRLETQDFFTWFIITVGILFGWLGTVQLVLSWFVSPVVALMAAKLLRKGNDVRKSTGSVTSRTPRMSLPGGIISSLRSLRSSRLPS